jgi:mRNA interferase MazF
MAGKVTRGDIVMVILPRTAYEQRQPGKARPALIVQADAFADMATVTVLPLTSEPINALHSRIDIRPSAKNGLRISSQVMIENAQTIYRDKIGGVIGRLERETMLAIDKALMVFLGLA